MLGHEMFDPLSIFTTCVIIYLVLLGLYRLYWSPIASFPGSKLTAVSGWYETYLDVFKGGQFTFQVQKWHQQYGQRGRSLTSTVPTVLFFLF